MMTLLLVSSSPSSLLKVVVSEGLQTRLPCQTCPSCRRDPRSLAVGLFVAATGNRTNHKDDLCRGRASDSNASHTLVEDTVHHTSRASEDQLEELPVPDEDLELEQLANYKAEVWRLLKKLHRNRK